MPPITTDSASVVLKTGEVQAIGTTILNSSSSIMQMAVDFLPSILTFVVVIMIVRSISGIGFRKSGVASSGSQSKKVFSSRSGI